MKIANKTEIEIEDAEISVRLNQNDLVCRYSVDIDDQMVDSFVVEKEVARNAFESEVRSSSSHSSLVEQVEGSNLFKAHLFPFHSLSSRTVFFSIFSPLSCPSPPPSSRFFDLSFSLSDPSEITHFGFDASVSTLNSLNELNGEPPLRTRNDNLPFDYSFSLSSDGLFWLSNGSSQSPISDHRFSVQFSLPKIPNCFVSYLEKSNFDGNLFFEIDDFVPSTTASVSVPGDPTPLFDCFIILWDKSVSRQTADLSREQSLLRMLQQQLSSKKTLLYFLPFSLTAETPIQCNSWDHLFQSIDSIRYDGATDLYSSLSIVADSSQFPISSCILLFTDGLNTMASDVKERIHDRSFPLPIYSFNSSEIFDCGLLKLISHLARGEFFDLSNSPITDDHRIFDSLFISPFSYLGCTASFGDTHTPTNELSIFPSLRTPLGSFVDRDPFRFSLVGKVPPHFFDVHHEVTLNLHYGYPGRIVVTTQATLAFPVSLSRFPNGDILSRYWAHKMISELPLTSPSIGQAKEEIIAVSKRYQLTTEYTSLLVLDQLDQFLKYNIEPPETLQSIREAWFDHKSSVEFTSERLLACKMSRLVETWNNRIEYWDSFTPLDVLNLDTETMHELDEDVFSQHIDKRKQVKIVIPIEHYPEYNFIGLIVGPRGMTKKKIESETGTQITILEGHSKTEPLQVEISAETKFQLESAKEIITKLIVPQESEHKLCQLKQLAQINGTLDNEKGAIPEEIPGLGEDSPVLGPISIDGSLPTSDSGSPLSLPSSKLDQSPVSRPTSYTDSPKQSKTEAMSDKFLSGDPGWSNSLNEVGDADWDGFDDGVALPISTTSQSQSVSDFSMNGARFFDANDTHSGVSLPKSSILVPDAILASSSSETDMVHDLPQQLNRECLTGKDRDLKEKETNLQEIELSGEFDSSKEVKFGRRPATKTQSSSSTIPTIGFNVEHASISLPLRKKSGFRGGLLSGITSAASNLLPLARKNKKISGKTVVLGDKPSQRVDLGPFGHVIRSEADDIQPTKLDSPWNRQTTRSLSLSQDDNSPAACCGGGSSSRKTDSRRISLATSRGTVVTRQGGKAKIHLKGGTFSENSESTIGAAFLSGSVSLPGGHKTQINFWDTAGQERYKSLAPMYYRGAHLAFLVYDSSSQSSFHHLKHNWANELKKQQFCGVVVVVANKNDLKAQRVPNSEGRKLAKCFGNDGLFFSVSAKTMEGLQLCLESSCEKVYQKLLQSGDTSPWKVVYLGDSGVGKTSLSNRLGSCTVDMSSFQHIPEITSHQSTKPTPRGSLSSLTSVRRVPDLSSPTVSGILLIVILLLTYPFFNILSLFREPSFIIFSQICLAIFFFRFTLIWAKLAVKPISTIPTSCLCSSCGSSPCLCVRSYKAELKRATVNERVLPLVDDSCPPEAPFDTNSLIFHVGAKQHELDPESTFPSHYDHLYSGDVYGLFHSTNIVVDLYKGHHRKIPPFPVSEGTTYEDYLSFRDSSNSIQKGDSHFFVQCADFFYSSQMKRECALVISTIAELDYGNLRNHRLAAYKMEEYGYYEEAESLFRKVKEMRGEEPQSLRDYSNSLVRLGRYQDAIDVMSDLIIGKEHYSFLWDVRFDGIEEIGLADLCGIVNKMRLHSERPIEPSIPPEIVNFLGWTPSSEMRVDCDLRAIVTWDTDMCDVELFVREPSGEVCSSFNLSTAARGRMSRNFTLGYGPQDYFVRRAIPGRYEIGVRLFSSRLNQNEFVTASIKIYSNFGRKSEQESIKTVALSKPRELIQVGSFYIEEDGRKNTILSTF